MNEQKPDETFAAQVESSVLELPPLTETAPGDAVAIGQLPPGMVMASPPLRTTSGRPTCPTCDSPDPKRHPAMQFEGEVQPCSDPWHVPGDAAIMRDLRAELEADDTPVIDEGTLAYRSELRAFTLGYRTCFEGLYGGISEMTDADLARLFRSKVEEDMRQAALKAEVGDVQGWVAAQDQLDPAAAATGAASEPPFDAVAEMQTVMGGDIHIPADSETVLGDAPLEELDVEKVLREQAAEIDRLNQASLRDTAAVQNWAAACDYFNELLAGTRWGDGPEPLLTRVQAFIAALRV